jgi:hypothetical protein
MCTGKRCSASAMIARGLPGISVLGAIFGGSLGDLREDHVGGFLVTLADRFLCAVDDPGVSLYRRRSASILAGSRREHPLLAPFKIDEVCLPQRGDEVTEINRCLVRHGGSSCWCLDDALRGDAGERLIEGETGSAATDSNLRAYVGIAPELFAANTGFGAFMTAFYKDQRFGGDAFLHQQNPFARRNVTAIVLEVPSDLIGKGKVNAWATISLFGHAPEVQVSRWGLPMVTHLFFNDPSDQEVKKEQFNASVPSEDLERFGKSISDFAEKMTTYAGSAADPGEYGKLLAARLCPDTLPYELGTSAAFEVASFNGRALGDDALDVMLTLVTNTPLVDGLAPDHGRIRKDFPYYGAPYTAEEQVGVTPMPRPAEK